MNQENNHVHIPQMEIDTTQETKVKKLNEFTEYRMHPGCTLNCHLNFMLDKYEALGIQKCEYDMEDLNKIFRDSLPIEWHVKWDQNWKFYSRLYPGDIREICAMAIRNKNKDSRNERLKWPVPSFTQTLDGMLHYVLFVEVLVSVTSKVEEMQENSNVATEIYAKQESTGRSGIMAENGEVVSRSIYVGNVGYFCTPEEAQEHFSLCGTINRVTILIDSYGYPKGYAFVEFEETGAVPNALLLHGSKLHGRQLRVATERLNIPDMSHGWTTPHFGFRYPDYFSPYGQFPRAGRYKPY